ncbi:hypothetical protein MP638_003322 [Amoeboaphelidium occidentale]|nr:hypothetical protein MP638_003322 [Amoeboaphelidium occidentale]
MSLARQNFAKETEQAINQQINFELNAAHVYLSVASYCKQDIVALPGFHKFFTDMVEDERKDADGLIDYQLRRGGQVSLGQIQAPASDWKSLRNALETALILEKDVNASLIALHRVAEEQNDQSLQDYIEGNYLEPQSKSIKLFSDLVTALARVENDGIGLYLLDRDVGDGKFPKYE